MATKGRRSGLSLKLLLRAVGIVVLSAILPATAVATPVIVTEDGPLRGITLRFINEYLGIPYAVRPVGLLRWMPPQPHGSWRGVFPATRFGRACIQRGAGSENCLYVNVYTPKQKSQGLPVMVWIHGGGLEAGAGALYNPRRIVVQSGVIVVTINYRLGLLGFFAHPAIDSEGHQNANYGLMDQQLALKWVQNNIAAFGGDPNRVTIFGESAGGQSVYANLASPTAAGLFQRAISQSGSYVEFQDYYDFIVSLATAETIGTPLVPAGTDIGAKVGCPSPTTAACLRAVPAAKLVRIQPPELYPIVDGTILAQAPAAAFASGQFNQVPVISGGTHDEYRFFVAAQYDAVGHPLVTLTDYENATIALFGPSLGSSVLSIYPSDSPSPGVALGRSGTDGLFACPERNGVRLLSKYVTTYAYEFNDERAYLVFNLFPQPFFKPITFPLGAAHATDVPYLFDILSIPSDFTPTQKQLSQAIISYWTQFAATGDPNSAGEPFWAPYHSTTDEFQSLVTPAPTVESTFDSDHMCSSFWNTF